MNRAPVLLVAVLFLAGCNGPGSDDGAVDPTPTPPTPSPPPPPDPPTAGSFLASPNDTWRYQGDAGEDVQLRVLAANASVVRLRSTTTDAGGNTTTSTSTLDARTFALMVLEDGRLGATLRFDPPLSVLIPAANHTHVGTVSVPTLIGVVQQPITGNVTFLGLEEITVPAGTFQTYHYVADFRSEGAFPFQQHAELWFAPEIHQAAKTLTDARSQELVAFATAG